VRASLRHQVIHALAKRHRNPLLRAGEKAARQYLLAIGNLNYDIATNGERWLVEKLAPTWVFDAGANIGDYAAMVRAVRPSSTVHCFEIVPATARACAARFSDDPNVVVQEYGLSDREGGARVKYFPEFTAGSTTFDYDHPFRHEWIDAVVRRADDYATEQAIEHLDLVKIDVEGGEYEVLIGMERLLNEHRVDAVQFEYGRVAVLTKRLLLDHFELFGRHGYVVGKLFPRNVEFRPYDVLRDEDFVGPNYVAVPKDSALVGELQGHA
jgi:FkbM family methyltransferase